MKPTDPAAGMTILITSIHKMNHKIDNKIHPFAAAASTDEEDFLMSRNMIIGLIVWNVILSLCILLLCIAVICICVDVDRLKKRLKSRYLQGIDNPQVTEVNVTNNDMRQLRGEEEVHYYNVGDLNVCKSSSAPSKF